MALTKDLSFVLLGQDKSASKTMSEASEKAEQMTARVGGAMGKFGGIVGGEFGSILSEAGVGISEVGEHAGSLTGVMAGAGGAIAGTGMALSEFGSGEAQAQAQLQQAVKNTGSSYDQYGEDIEKAVKKQEGFGHSAADTKSALTTLTDATDSPKKALESLGVVSDLAAAQHMKMGEAAKLVARVINGNGGRTLAQYGIQMDTTKSKTAAGAEALDELSKKLSGQAAASTQSFGAQVGILKTRIGDWAGEMAQKAGPAMTVVGAGLTGLSAAMEIGKSVAGLFSKSQEAIATSTKIADTAVGASDAAQATKTVSTEAGTVATEEATAAQNGFNLSLLANPITIVILAITALVAGLVWFFTQTKIGRQIWGDFTQALATAWNWLWNSVLQPTFQAFGAMFNWLWNAVIKPIITLIVAQVHAMGDVFNWVWNSIISPVATWISGVFHTMASDASSAFGGIGSAIKAGFSGAVGFIRSSVNGVIDVINGAIGGINTLIKGVNSIPGVSIGTIGKIPHMATGGIATGPTIALIGESGPEAVVPLNNGGSYGYGGGAPIVFAPQVTVQGAVLGTQAQMAQQVASWLISAIRSGQLGNELSQALKGVG